MKEKLQQALFTSLAKYEYIDDALEEHLFYLSHATSDDTLTEDYRKECSHLSTMYWLYRNYLDPHDCNPENRKKNEYFDYLTPLKELLKSVDYSLMKQSNVPHSSIMRIKSLTHFTEKMWRNTTPSKSNVHDLIAFSFILHGNTPKEYVLECYNYALLLNELMVKHRFILCPAKAPKGCASENEIQLMADTIYIPNRSEIPIEILDILKGLKDYILKPKSNKYQGLHLLFYNPVLAIYAECQIKTLIMEENAKHGTACHDGYKAENATGLIKTDLSDFNCIHGFHADQNGNVLTDKVGLDIARKYTL